MRRESCFVATLLHGPERIRIVYFHVRIAEVSGKLNGCFFKPRREVDAERDGLLGVLLLSFSNPGRSVFIGFQEE